MLRIITINTNGIRSAFNKGLLEWMLTQDADFICMQELKAQEADLSKIHLEVPGYEFHGHFAQRRGYSGVAIYTRHRPARISAGIGIKKYDSEGRYIQIDLDNLSIVSVYFPSGTTDERQEIKLTFLKQFMTHLRKLRKQGREVILCGDFNIAHKEIDIKNWKGNLDHPGFLPIERDWLTRLFTKEGWSDVFRLLNQEPDQYTWWSNRGQARAKNVGWRIDYQIGTKEVSAKAKSARIYREKMFSDHAPVIIDYDWDLH
ncbi:MAG: exodeoxyribonuclease III [Burkholderiales bacterium]|nr:exodeoxyribonuclease III [Burkholderiales bacterium]